MSLFAWRKEKMILLASKGVVDRTMAPRDGHVLISKAVNMLLICQGELSLQMELGLLIS